LCLTGVCRCVCGGGVLGVWGWGGRGLSVGGSFRCMGAWGAGVCRCMGARVCGCVGAQAYGV
jgi:hypothetical protein